MKNKTILIIEDSYSSLILLDEVLQTEGYKTKLASNVNEAISLINKEHPDIILLDLNLPKVSGVDFLKMRRELNIEHIPVLIISAYDSHKSIRQVMALGASDFIAKPLNISIFLEKVNSLLR